VFSPLRASCVIAIVEGWEKKRKEKKKGKENTEEKKEKNSEHLCKAERSGKKKTQPCNAENSSTSLKPDNISLPSIFSLSTPKQTNVRII